MFSGVSKLIKRYRKKTLRDGGSLFQLDEAAQYLHTVLEFRTSLHSNCNHREIGRFWTIVTELETDIWTLAETLYICTCTYMCSLCIHTMFMYMHLCLCVSLCVYYASTPYFLCSPNVSAHVAIYTRYQNPHKTTDFHSTKCIMAIKTSSILCDNNNNN